MKWCAAFSPDAVPARLRNEHAIGKAWETGVTCPGAVYRVMRGARDAPRWMTW